MLTELKRFDFNMKLEVIHQCEVSRSAKEQNRETVGIVYISNKNTTVIYDRKPVM
jgi:hypothetical protein